MHAAKISDPRQEFLQITQHDKFYCRLLSKESSGANPSFRVYYGGASGAVPFLWESQPGTPKNAAAAAGTLPPLTPPPSHHPNPHKNAKKSSLPGPTPKKTTSLLPSSPSVSSSGSQSSFYDGESADGASPTSILSKGVTSHEGNGGPRGCYSMAIVKNALSSIVCGHGSTQGTAA